MAHFWEQNCSASISVSKHSSCSNSESRKAFKRDRAVLMTEAIACSEVLSAAPASHFALCSSGSRSMSCWNWFLPFWPVGASRGLDEFEHRQDVPFRRRAELRHQQYCGGQQTFGGIVEIGVLAEGGAVRPGQDDSFAMILAYFSALALSLNRRSRR